MDKRGEDLGAGAAERVTERDAAAVDVDLRGIELQLADAGDRLRGERFVQLDEIDLIDCQTGSLEGLLCRGNRAESHTAWIHTTYGRSNDPRHRRRSASSAILRRHKQCRRSIIDAAGARCRDRSVLLERRLQLSDTFEGGSGPWVLVFRERPSIGQLDGHELVSEHALLERALGPLLALDGERILFGAADFVALRDNLGGLAE